MAALGLTTIPAEAGHWRPFAPGVTRKVLFNRAGTLAFLLKLEAGAVIPAHAHTANEECLVLEGTVEIAGAVAHEGAFHFAPGSVPHTPITARTAALLYLRTAI